MARKKGTPAPAGRTAPAVAAATPTTPATGAPATPATGATPASVADIRKDKPVPHELFVEAHGEKGQYRLIAYVVDQYGRPRKVDFEIIDNGSSRPKTSILPAPDPNDQFIQKLTGTTRFNIVLKKFFTEERDITVIVDGIPPASISLNGPERKKLKPTPGAGFIANFRKAVKYNNKGR